MQGRLLSVREKEVLEKAAEEEEAVMAAAQVKLEQGQMLSSEEMAALRRASGEPEPPPEKPSARPRPRAALGRGGGGGGGGGGAGPPATVADFAEELWLSPRTRLTTTTPIGTLNHFCLSQGFYLKQLGGVATPEARRDKLRELLLTKGWPQVRPRRHLDHSISTHVPTPLHGRVARHTYARSRARRARSGRTACRSASRGTTKEDERGTGGSRVSNRVLQACGGA